MTREKLANLLIEHSVAMFRVKAYERRIIEAVQEIDAPRETVARFLTAAGVGDAEGFDLPEAMRLLFDLLPNGGQR